MLSDVRGIPSHGVNRLDLYCDELKRGAVDPHGKPEVVSDALAVALVDGHNAQGPVVGKFCMDLAIEKAKSVGCAWVVCKNSNHYGIAVCDEHISSTFYATHTHTHSLSLSLSRSFSFSLEVSQGVRILTSFSSHAQSLCRDTMP